MYHSRNLPRASTALLASALIAACTQHATTMLPALPSAPDAAGIYLPLPDASPPKCKGQKSTKNYASLAQKLSTQGGSLCVPAFGGFGGTIRYPGANPSVKMTLKSSTKNFDHFPALGSGKVLFYLGLALSGGTSFGTNVPAGGGVSSKSLQPGKPYTAFGEAVIFGIQVNFTPCYTVAKSSKYGGTIGGLGTLLKNQNVPSAASGVIEVYSGHQAGAGKC